MLFKTPIELITEARIERHRPAPIHAAGWTPERVQLLRELWDDLTISARQIAEILGSGISRNAVLGKAHRLKLADRPHVRPPKPAGARKKKTTRVRKVKEATPVLVAPVERVVPENEPQFLCIGIQAMESHHCRFPIGHPGEEGFGFCGLDRPFGAIYCDWHHAIAFVKHSTIKRSRADTERRIREMTRKGALKTWAA